MILRIFQVITHHGREADFGRYFHETAIPLMQGTPGLVSVIPRAPRPESPRDFAMVMTWRDLAALKAFAGGDHSSAHIHPGEADLVAARRIMHYAPVPV